MQDRLFKAEPLWQETNINRKTIADFLLPSAKFFSPAFFEDYWAASKARMEREELLEKLENTHQLSCLNHPKILYRVLLKAYNELSESLKTDFARKLSCVITTMKARFGASCLAPLTPTDYAQITQAKTECWSRAFLIELRLIRADYVLPIEASENDDYVSDHNRDENHFGEVLLNLMGLDAINKSLRIDYGSERYAQLIFTNLNTEEKDILFDYLRSANASTKDVTQTHYTPGCPLSDEEIHYNAPLGTYVFQLPWETLHQQLLPRFIEQLAALKPNNAFKLKSI